MKSKKVLYALILIPILALAQNSPFEEFIVGIWPEYDHPGVLILYQGTVTEDHLPLRLEVAVTPETQFVLGFGQSDTSGKMLPLQVDERQDGRWAIMDIVKSQFQLEFYYNPFGDGIERVIHFPFKINRDIADFHVAVQQPVMSEHFVFVEPDAETFSDDHGVTYHRIHIPEYIAGETRILSIRYENPTGQTSIEALQRRLSGGSGKSPSRAGGDHERVERYRLPKYEPLLVLGALALIIGFIFRKTNRKPITAAAGEGKRFCSHCGTAVNSSDNFCGNCGKKAK